MLARALLAAGLLAASLMIADPAAAGALAVSPTRLDLAPGRPSGTVTVQNNGTAPVMLQVETLAWRDSAITDLPPTRELVAVPPLSRIAPGEQQTIRVARRGTPSGQVEESFRLLLSEVPSEERGRGGVQFALRISLPVFITPSGAGAQPRWRVERQGSALRLALGNDGTAHILVRRLEIVGRNGRSLGMLDGPTYVLAGREHRWPLPQVELKGADSITIRAETSLGELELVLPVQGG